MGTQSDVLVSLTLPTLQELERKTPYSKPIEVGFYSKDATGNVLSNSRQLLAQYKEPELPLDLNIGYPEKYIKRDPVPVRLTDLLKATVENTHKVEFLTWRGIMTKILSTPYFAKEGWEFGATLHKGTIYIEEHPKEQETYENEDLQTYYGYNFESLCTSTDGNPPTAGVNTNVQYCSIFESKLGNHKLLLGAEVDCMIKPPDSSKADGHQRVYAELKTHKYFTERHHNRSFIRNKLLKTWLQCYLAGVNHVVFGFKTPDGMVVKTQGYNTNELPRLARKENLWDPHVCLTFGEIVLLLFKKNITIDDPQTVYTIKYHVSDRTVRIYSPTVGGDAAFVLILE